MVGAGDGGNIFINTVEDRKLNFEIVGIVDRDPNKLGTFIRNTKVLGNRNDIPRLVEELAVDQVTIAIPSLNGKEREKIVEICNTTGVTVNNMPSIEDIMAGNMSVSAFQEIDVADLLGRPEVVLDQDELNQFLKGKQFLSQEQAARLVQSYVVKLLSLRLNDCCCLDMGKIQFTSFIESY